MENLQMLAGSISSVIFMLGTLSMLIKAWRTRDVRSYSLAQIGLSNIGNIVHWIYIISLPFGPIWFLHSFFTLSTGIMLIWCLMYRYAPVTAKNSAIETLNHPSLTARRITQTLELIRIESGERETLKREDIA